MTTISCEDSSAISQNVEPVAAVTSCLLAASAQGGLGFPQEAAKTFKTQHHCTVFASVCSLIQDLAGRRCLCGIELHATLQGSISPQFLNTIIKLRNERKQNQLIAQKRSKSESSENSDNLTPPSPPKVERWSPVASMKSVLRKVFPSPQIADEKKKMGGGGLDAEVEEMQPKKKDDSSPPTLAAPSTSGPSYLLPDSPSLPAMALMPESDDTLKAITDPKDRLAYHTGVSDTIDKIVDNLELTRLAVEDVLMSYACEGVSYLELRTFPLELKHHEGEGAENYKKVLASRREYVEAVCETIQCLQQQPPTQGSKAGEQGPSEYPSLEALTRWYNITLLQQKKRGFTLRSSLPAFTQEMRKRLRIMKVKLLLTIDRHAPVAVAEETVDLAISFARTSKKSSDASISPVKEVEAHREGDGGTAANAMQVVGIDVVVGHPSTPTACPPSQQDVQFTDYAHCFAKARSHGLRISLQAGGGADESRKLSRELDQFRPDRYGHDGGPLEELLQLSDGDACTPVAFSISRTMLLGGYSSPLEHPIQKWFFEESQEQARMDTIIRCTNGAIDAKTFTLRINQFLFHCQSDCPISTNTTDRGVLCTTLFQEQLHFCCIVADGLRQRVARLRQALKKASSKPPSLQGSPTCGTFSMFPDGSITEEAPAQPATLVATPFVVNIVEKNLAELTPERVGQFVRECLKVLFEDSLAQRF